MGIFNAGLTKLSYDNIGIPNVADIVHGWIKPLSVTLITKTISDGDVIETGTPLNINGMVQPLSGYELTLLREGERDWEWVKIYTDYANFNNDDKLFIVDTYYRVMKKRPFERYGYGYYRYDAVLDYIDGVPPNEE